jgi:anti-anti-sigma factor
LTCKTLVRTPGINRAPSPRVYRNDGVMTVILKLCPTRAHIVRVKSSLGIPGSRALRHRVRALLRRGERRIVLDLSAVSRIDAAGVGELIRAFNMTAAVNGALRVVNATAWVREILERAHVFEVLSGETTGNRQFA